MLHRRLPSEVRAFLLAASVHLLALAALCLPKWAGLLTLAPLASSTSQTQAEPLWIEMASNRAEATQIPPQHARVMSDRHRRVEREQKARASLDSLQSLRALAPRPLDARSALRGDIAEEQRTASAVQRMDIPGVAEGAENLLNTRESVFYSFYARIYDPIAPLWQRRVREAYSVSRLQPGRYTTRVVVTLGRDGSLDSVELLGTSSIGAFDHLALDSWSRVSRFPNPPEGLRDPDGRVRTTWNFTVEVDDGNRVIYLPPRRS